ELAERVLVTWLVYDASASMAFGTADRRKADVAEGVAVAIGHLTTQRGNRLGIVTFGGSRDRRVPPAAGRTGLLGLLLASRVETVEEGVGVTSPAEALRIANAAATRGGLVILVSDFRGPRDWRGPLAGLAARHHVIAIEIDDPRESDLPDVGELTLVDAETGREVKVDTSSSHLRERFASAAAEERASVATDLRRLGVDHIVLSTAGDWLRTLAGELRLRGIRS
ncbi:MAG TPA: VWA domain-containing protein, partial [Candidatus Limnocylindrales bacterium]